LRRSSDLTELPRISVENSIRDHPHESGDQDIAYAIASAIPREAIEDYHPISTSQVAALQEIIADILVEKAPWLTEIKTFYRDDGS